MEHPDNETIERQIIERFFDALDFLAEKRKIKSIKKFCEDNKMSYPNLMRLKYPSGASRTITNIMLYINI